MKNFIFLFLLLFSTTLHAASYGSLLGSGASGGGITTYNGVGSLPASASEGDQAVDYVSGTLYVYHSGAWQVVGAPGVVVSFGALDSQAKDAKGGVISGNTVYQQTVDGTYPGLATSAMYNSWNAKEPAITATTSADYYRGDKSFQNFNSAAISSTLTGYTSGAGVISNADSILSAIQKLNGNASLNLGSTDATYLLSNSVDATKQQNWDLSGETSGKELTIAPQNTSNMTLHIPQVQTAGGAAMALVQDETTGYIFSSGVTAPIGGGNSMMQLANATTANRAQIKLHSYVNAASVAGVSTLTSKSGTIGVNSAIGNSQDYSKWTAQASPSAGAAPIVGTWAFKSAASGIGGNQVPSDYHISLMNQAGVLGDRFYLNSEGLLQLPGYGAGILHFDSSGNVTSSSVALSDMATIAAGTILGNNTGGAAVPSALTIAQVSGMTNALTGWTSGAGVITAADSIQSALQKLDGNVAAITPVPALTAGSVPYANGTTLTENNTDLFWDNANKNLKLNSSKFQTNYTDPFSRPAIWGSAVNQTLELGSWQTDGLPTNVNSEGIIVYGDEQLAGVPIAAGDGSYARIKAGRFGLFSVSSTIPFYAGGQYWYRVDPTEIYFRNNAGTKIFNVQRSSGNTTIAGTLNVTGVITGTLSGNASTATALAANPTDCGAGTKATAIDASGNLTCSAVADGDISSGVDAAKIADGSVSNTEFQYINSLSSNAQTQLNGKQASFTWVEAEVPTGAIDNSNVSYTLAHSPIAGSFKVYKNGRRLASTEYSRVTTALTMTTALNYNDELLVDYAY